MYEELIERLRSAESNCQETLDCLCEAADAIEELSYKYKKAIGDLVKGSKPKWIPVTERLPDNIDEEVLVSTEDYGKSGLGFVTVAVYDGNDWLECWERKTYLTAVTHWMPLPSAPTEE